MKRSNLGACVLCFTTVLAASIASAQDDLRIDRAPGTVSPANPGVRSAYDGVLSLPAATAHPAEPVRLSQLMNGILKNQNGESLGQVRDIIVDSSNGEVQFAVLSLNGTAVGSPGISTSTTSGISTTAAGGQLVAIPWRLVNSSGQGQFTASVDRITLQSAPTFSSSSWPTMNPTWMQSINSHFGVNGTSLGSPGSSSGTGTGRGTGLGNPSTPGVPSTPGTPDIGSPGGLRPTPGATPSGGGK